MEKPKKGKIDSLKSFTKKHAKKVAISAAMLAATMGIALGYANSTKEKRMHSIDDPTISSKIFANLSKLKNAKEVVFTSAGGVSETFATIERNENGDIVVRHGDVVVVINPSAQKALGYSKFQNENWEPRYLDDESINNVLNMCVNGCIDFTAKIIR